MDKNKTYYKKLFSKSSWDTETLSVADEITSRIGRENFNLKTYPNQIEIVTSEQMLDAYALIGLPTSYSHWKFGKNFSMNQAQYQKGQMGLSYEMVINSDPCISYNMETNTTCLMTLVIAHACQGHNAFFANNYMFKDWTSADSIVDYMVFARDFIIKCEEEFGTQEVEDTLDACHALMNHGIDQYKRPNKRLEHEENERLKDLVKIKRENFNELWNSLPIREDTKVEENPVEEDWDLEEENLLYFLEKNAPKLPKWKTEIIRIVRKVSQYFYPQGMTKVMNEGYATFMHYHIVNQMYEEGYLEEKFMLEFYHHHSNVLYQPNYSDKGFYGLNPYTLGFNIFMDIKRICQEPTEEDKEWFPFLVGKDWLDEINYAMENFRDDSFILQYLSPKVMRDMKLFAIRDKEEEQHYEISSIHNQQGYHKLREALSEQYSREKYVPRIQIKKVEKFNNYKLELAHLSNQKQTLDEAEALETLKHFEYLWGFPVSLNSFDSNKKPIKSYSE